MALFCGHLPITANADAPEIRHHLRTQWITEISSADDVDERHQRFELRWQPEIEWQLGSNARLHGRWRLRMDAFDELVPGHPNNSSVSTTQQILTKGDHVELELRELYLEWQTGKTWWTIGKQQIVWGKADGLKVLDVVNPQDFREFILEDFEDSRIPLWAIHGEIPVGSFTFEPIWIPDRTFHRLPDADWRYALTSPRLVPPAVEGIEILAEEPRRPASNRSELGLRISTFWRGWDLTFNYLYHFADIAAPFRTLQHDNDRPVIHLTPSYERNHLLGGSFANAFGSLTVRGEIGYNSDRWTPVNDLGDADGVTRGGELTWVLGVDGFGFTDTLWSIQLFHNRLRGNTDRLFFSHSEETRASFLVRRTLLNERLETELLWLHDLDLDDGLVRFEVRFDWSDTVRWQAGLDVFYGDSLGLFGQFAHRDRLLISASWSP